MFALLQPLTAVNNSAMQMFRNFGLNWIVRVQLDNSEWMTWRDLCSVSVFFIESKSLKFVRQWENCESQVNDSPYFQFWSDTVPPPIAIKIIMLHCMIIKWYARLITQCLLCSASCTGAVASRVTVWTYLSTYKLQAVLLGSLHAGIICYLQKDIWRKAI